ncbi:MAG: carbohydrate-binding family 9-like protein [Acidobacteriota bacterium]|nr:carbohydrate-binding family 9-like protein [Acidobacteriota bacterium]
MSRITASEFTGPLNEELLPTAAAWEKAEPVIYSADWRGESPDPQRETQARLLWSREFLYIQFRCRYRELCVYAGNNGRRDRLWERDVAEIFIRPPGHALRHYFEFEISPNGDWLDLEIEPGKKTIVFCSLQSRVRVDAEARIWTAEMAIPIDCLTTRFRPDAVWSLNLFRIEGCEPDRFYSAWQPTFTPQPNFHVPEVFGELHFAGSGGQSPSAGKTIGY